MINPEIQLAFQFIEFTNRNIFLTGKAGTGKTTFLHNLRKSSPKRMIVVAPTGVAAINAGGVTIHSFFQLPFHPHVPSQYIADQRGATAPPESGSYKLSRDKANIIRSLDLLVIDEISMVRADLLDAVDGVLRRFRNRHLPFGGVQLLMIGDLQQLAPVVKEEDREILDRYYRTSFFFGSLALQQTDYVTIELLHVYRQKDLAFITLLNRIRDNQLDNEAMQEINKRYNPHFTAGDEEGYITLTTHNAQAQQINDTKLAALRGKMFTFKASVKGDFPEYAYPTLPELQLKIGAQVMFVKNDISPEKRYFNGKIGRITDIDGDGISVLCQDDDLPIEVGTVEWANMKYTLNEDTREIDEAVIGTFTQVPLRLAWAITIHKSQGLTFDRAIIDARAAFAHGQVYVALSRCRTLEGLVLSTPVSRQGVITDPTVSEFARDAVENRPDGLVLETSKRKYQEQLIRELFDFSALSRLFSYFRKLVSEHEGSLVGNLIEESVGMERCLQEDLTGVAVKFEPQLARLLRENPDPDGHEALRERIMKACDFFAGKLKPGFHERLEKAAFRTDNREIRKSVQDAMTRLQTETVTKLACLDSCKTGFSIKNYLDAKAKSSVEISAPKSKSAASLEDISGSVQNPALFARLTAWCSSVAKDADIPLYMVLPQKTITNLSSFMPQNLDELKLIKGMGKKKAEQFGEEILDIIAQFCREKGIERKPLVPKTTSKKAPKVKIDTKLASYTLFRAGKKPDEIARERSLSRTTVEEHLASFVATGEIDVEELVDSDQLDLILAQFKDRDDLSLSPVKAALGDQVSWSEIRFVARHLEFRRKIGSD